MMLLLFLFGLTLGAVSPSDEREVKLQRGNCPMFWFSFNGRCYKYFATRVGWSDAALQCLSQRASLVSIHSLEEQNFVNFLIKNFDHAEGPTWIGLSDRIDKKWMWSDGAPLNFTLWNGEQPKPAGEYCAYTNYGGDVKWKHQPCGYSYAYVCASRIDCPL
ncbi:lactose-binding lectin l-2-like [Lates calcarifer]|uniref:Lactose-binding lectin l-2-like n=1 Tax=Lates calcarifer TaxID=8187 RepID=A0AAJ7QLV9_LATCA|nr:lactose-binding lectin l-2-like [Lates calcarifer]XP_018559188.1 lactose-binding lectin l-2-like [Lates calcarifer]